MQSSAHSSAPSPLMPSAPTPAGPVAPAVYSLDYAARPVAHTPPWGMLTVVDVLLNNLALGLFLAATFCVALRPEGFSHLAGPAFLLAWLLLMLDLLLLILDLGHPARFHHMLRTVRPLSPMWVGVWALSLSGLFLTFPALWGVLHMLARADALPPPLAKSIADTLPPVTLRMLLGIVLVPGALCAAAGLLYKGVLFSATSRPVWKEARWFPAYCTNGAVLLGCAALTGLTLLLRDGGDAPLLFPAMMALLALDALCLELHLRPLLRDAGQTAPAKALRTASLMDGVAFTCLLAACVGAGSLPIIALALACIAASALLGRLCFLTAGRPDEKDKSRPQAEA